MSKSYKDYQKNYREKNKAREKIRKAIWWRKKRIALGKNIEQNQKKIAELQCWLDKNDYERINRQDNRASKRKRFT